MVEFNTMYYAPADREMHELEERPSRKRLEDPIIPIRELGITVPEMDTSGRVQSFVKNVQAAIRRGTGQLQIVMQAPHTSPVGGRFKGAGKEVREQLKEVLLANDAEIVGFELPTSLSNLSGLDQQKGAISEETRQKHLKEIHDAIRFAADIGQGGGIDVLSWEFPRTIFDAKWNQEGKWKGAFEIAQEEEQSSIQFVDGATGKIKQVGTENLPPPPGFEESGRTWKWNEYREFANKLKKDQKKYQEYKNVLGSDKENWAFDLLKESFYGRQERQAKRMELYHHSQFKANQHQADAMKAKAVEMFKTKDETKWAKEIKDEIKLHEDLAKQELIQAKEQASQVKEAEQEIRNLQPLASFAKNNSFKSYSEAGIMAMEETHKTKNIRRPISVGPEIGWPYAYGSHPEEFKELILSARKEMVKRLTDKKGSYKYSQKQAEEQAKIHIQGTFDTGHLGMWLEQFKPHLPWEKRVKEFNKWYMEYVSDLAKSGVVGGLQLVDAHGPEHAHLPPGQGIFPVVEAAKEFKKQGFTGFLVSEGHEEEMVNEGRILLKTWEAFDAPIGNHYGPGIAEQTWNDVNQGYFGRQYAPRQMFGSYTPPNAEYRPWAGGKNPISFE
ncbi:hypothetical protein COV11_03345 [Candidatus Woesearchaeota archaeon CG10_big_fil_rev_8_21_14_0_10_30_7]|nr:MAG: hypothetical protein COV11_03345 [Candidatus Woesearchaeota archaeon CG10_big_fil_rev_8_21_14_0_10_30_7]